MTNEEKQAFFCVYPMNEKIYYREIFFKDGQSKIVGAYTIYESISGIDAFYTEAYPTVEKVNDFLELRNIDSLTDDEINVMQGRSIERKVSTDLRDFAINDSFHWAINSDYLRSIGVLVGFRQFTPEMLIAEGVVKIKDV